MRSFGSDNHSGVSPEVIEALRACNDGSEIAYGDDVVTKRVELKFRDIFGSDSSVYFVFNGTAANVLVIQALCKSYEAVICSSMAHIHTSECGAPEKVTGCKLIPIATPNGKLTVDLIRSYLTGRGDEHHVQPRLISLTQVTEVGTVYTLNELKEIVRFAKSENLFVHLDGARLSNAAASLSCTLREMTTDLGIDALSLGGTKNGLMGAEAVVFLKNNLAPDFKFYRKQNMQLSSKMRFISAQFEAYLSHDLWLKNASHANSMARLLANGVKNLPGVEICYPVDANGVFAKMPKNAIAKLQKEFFFHIWDEEKSIVRWMTSFNTSPADIEDFVKALKLSLS